MTTTAAFRPSAPVRRAVKTVRSFDYQFLSLARALTLEGQPDGRFCYRWMDNYTVETTNTNDETRLLVGGLLFHGANVEHWGTGGKESPTSIRSA